MRNYLLISVLLILSLLPFDLYAEPDTKLFEEIDACREDEIISAVSSPDYLNALKSMGYYKYDYKDDRINLRNAVVRFQSDCNLTVDGIQGPKFKRAMLKRLLTNENFSSRDIIAKAPSQGYWMTINLSKRILTLYAGKTVIRKYPVAIGKNDYRTPEGKFHVYLKRKNPYWTGGRNAEPVAGGSPQNPLGKRWIGLSPGKGNYYGIHGNNSPYSIGRAVSKGCIRMINSDVLALYIIVPIGTPVWIGEDSTLRKWGVTQKSFY